MNAPLPDPDPTTRVTAPEPRRRSRTATVGLAAGLLAGGAIGLVATVPGFTSAATDDGAAVVQQDDQQDDGLDQPTDAVERPEPGERLRELLQPLVDGGTIDAGQADAVAEHLVENRPERGDRPVRPGRRGIDHHGRHDSTVADLLGVDRETLRSELMAGKSIADVAEENGVDVQNVIDALVADAESHIELAVEHGLDEEAAAQRLERITARITEMVDRSRPTGG